MTFRTVFDAAHQGYGTWWFPGFGLIFVCVGVLVTFRPALVPKFMPSGFPGRPRKLFGRALLVFAGLWTIVAFATTYGQYRTVENTLGSGRYDVVEGPVTDFVPMPYTGHSQESFVVGGRRFSYSDYIVTSGFHNTASHGGPIREGLYVRVSYVGNLILRLEVAE